MESKPKILYEPVPVIFIFAVNTTLGKDPRLYECPIYRKPKRTDANYIGSIDFQTDSHPKRNNNNYNNNIIINNNNNNNLIIDWIMRGVALLCDTK